jgi:glycerophosphoryl diester phosphodiesterase
VVPWTVNQPADMARLVDWGVDGLITDYPDRARAVLAERGITPR